MAVLLVGTLDTKGLELGLVRDLLREQGVETLVVDAGWLGPPLLAPDIDRDEVFRRAGISSAAVRQWGDRGKAVAEAARAVAVLAEELHQRIRLEGILAIGGSAGT